MEFTIEDILNIENNGRQFICLSNGSIVKNVDGFLYYSKMIEFTGGKKAGCLSQVEIQYQMY
ncbi:hypothetical protein N496_19675 (plasmid) [Clostridium botulinum A2B3 87]|uniref:hypothetical protein n=1 Tax=Clostridium botulinum TaxID=1491 RepID=UPI0004A5853B|nr:hypothetical protein [Clostridium botulinum]KEI95166.1 hypothetical protein N496_19675 [Clostridium botulinum A2B3 87]